MQLFIYQKAVTSSSVVQGQNLKIYTLQNLAQHFSSTVSNGNSIVTYTMIMTILTSQYKPWNAQ